MPTALLPVSVSLTSSRRYSLATIIVIAVVSTFLPIAAAATEPCRPLSELIGIDPNSFLRSHNDQDSYFCAATAPKQFQCSCGASATCDTFLDPWGRDLGRCGCCPTWLYILFAVFGVFLLVAILFFAYGCCMRGRWWCDGFPYPIRVALPKRGPAVVAAAGQRLPDNLFRGYRSEEFVDGHNNNNNNNAPQQEQQQQQPAATSSSGSTMVRRHVPVPNPPSLFSTPNNNNTHNTTAAFAGAAPPPIVSVATARPSSGGGTFSQSLSSNSPPPISTAEPSLQDGPVEPINVLSSAAPPTPRPLSSSIPPSPTPHSNISPQLHMLRLGSSSGSQHSHTAVHPHLQETTSPETRSSGGGVGGGGGSIRLSHVLHSQDSGEHHDEERSRTTLTQNELDLL